MALLFNLLMIAEAETTMAYHTGGILFALLIAAATLVRFALDRSNGHLRPLFAGSTLTLDHRPGSFLEQNIDTIV